MIQNLRKKMKFSFVIFTVLYSLMDSAHTTYWHAYDKALINITKPGCEDFETATKPVSLEFINRLKLWPGLMNGLDVEHGSTMYGWRAAIEKVYENQYPVDCMKAKFLISGGWPYGFGSRIHVEGWGLALAMQMGRVYLHHPDGDNIFWETHIPFCINKQKDMSMTCFYERWSHCNFSNALRDNNNNVNALLTINPGDVKDIFGNEEQRNAIIKKFERHTALNVIYTTGHVKYDPTSMIPSTLRPILECSPMNRHFMYYWWRAVSASFLLRPNAGMLEELTKLRSVPIDDDDSCIAMFVRHGDKGIEMKLVEFELYMQVAQLMWDQGMVPRSSPNRNGTIMLSTDDPTVIRQADEFSQKNAWKVVYTNLFDRGKQTARLSWQDQHKKGTKAVHDDLEYISMLLNLEYSIRCEAWVCTMASNSCRIIDELRATIGGKANRHYADMSKETCEHPPCIDEGISFPD